MFSLRWIERVLRALFLRVNGQNWIKIRVLCLHVNGVEIKKPPGRVADFWFCLCVTGTLAGDLDNGV